ncbi:Uncharacterised protein [Budvicia aquatica]|uniref:Uncharacterized protein n=1 Tax=Budvicia aquatica TaxID=82979 RepID=A0A484ZKF4_9GAMM|nr:Uncharacterised protein [Budvicia aquatica]
MSYFDTVHTDYHTNEECIQEQNYQIILEVKNVKLLNNIDIDESHG